MTRNYVSPTGSLIVGTSDTVLATALIVGINDDGTPEYAGESEIHWDSQKPKERGGQILFEDEDGEEWTFDQLKPEEDGQDEETGDAA